MTRAIIRLNDLNLLQNVKEMLDNVAEYPIFINAS